MSAASPNERIVIVGAGQAGANVAMALRQSGYAGAVVLLGEERHPPYERPPLSKAVLLETSALEDCHVQAPANYAQQQIDLRTGQQVLAIDRTAKTLTIAGHDDLPYDYLVLATGARARQLDVPGADHPAVHYLRTADEALALRSQLQAGRHLLVIGGGFIGLEIAASARQRGLDVTVLEQAPALIPRVLPAEVGAWLEGFHRDHGVNIYLGAQVSAIQDAAGKARVISSAGQFDADLVVVGVGSIPNTQLAEAAGLAVDGGVLVDEYGATSDPSIYAAGDVTRHFNAVAGCQVRLESWKNAQNQGIAVGKALAGKPEPYQEAPWLWTDQYDFNLQLAGLPDGRETLIWRGLPQDGRFTVFGVTDDVVRYAITVNQGRDMRFAQRLIVGAKPIDPHLLADTGTPLQRMVA